MCTHITKTLSHTRAVAPGKCRYVFYYATISLLHTFSNSRLTLNQSCEAIIAGYKNDGRQVAPASEFCTVVPPNALGPQNLLYVIFLAPVILWWLLDFWKNLCSSIRVGVIDSLVNNKYGRIYHLRFVWGTGPLYGGRWVILNCGCVESK